MNQTCDCEGECARKGWSEDGSYGWFTPYIPKQFGEHPACKLTLEERKRDDK